MRHEVVTRPFLNQLPDIALPFYPRSAGYECQPAGVVCDAPGSAKPFVEVFWCIAGRGEFCIGDRRFELAPGDVCYQLPGEPHRQSALSSEWEYRWLSFDGPHAADFMLSYGYERHLPGAGHCPVEWFKRYEIGLSKLTPGSLRELVALTAQVLARAGARSDGSSASGSPEAELASRFSAAVEAHLNDAFFNVDAAAAQLGIHRATLNRAVRRQLGMPPGEFLRGRRIQTALSLLYTTELPVAEVAFAVGIADPALFSRLVRRATGMAPTAYRKSGS